MPDESSPCWCGNPMHTVVHIEAAPPDEPQLLLSIDASAALRGIASRVANGSSGRPRSSWATRRDRPESRSLVSDIAPLVKFLRARLTEEEALANAANSDGARLPWGDLSLKPVPPEEWGDLVEGYLGGEVGEHCACWMPLRVLAEIAAKRRIIDGCVERIESGSDESGPLTSGADLGTTVLRCLAQPYADHLGFDPRWKAG